MRFHRDTRNGLYRETINGVWITCMSHEGVLFFKGEPTLFTNRFMSKEKSLNVQTLFLSRVLQ